MRTLVALILAFGLSTPMWAEIITDEPESDENRFESSELVDVSDC